MAVVNTSLSFSTTGQSLWRPGPAEDLRIDTGDTLLWDPGEYTKSFDTGTFLGFGAAATFYASARFGLVAFANLGTGGSFDASYDIDLTVDLPGAVLTQASDPGSKVTFRYAYDEIEVSNATLNSIGFGNSTDEDISIGAGLNLITDLSVGFRDITFFTPFKDIVFDDVSIINIENDFNLFTVTPDDAELEIPLTDDVTLTARLPTGANVEATSEDTVVGGTGFSDTKFIELEADLDSLLTSMLNKIPLPPVKAAAKFLEEFVFAEHTFDLSDYLTFLPADKIEFNFTLLDISASAGLVITEDVALDITAPDGVTPYLRVTLTSEETGESTTGLLGLFGESETILELDAPDEGFGTDTITGEYEIVEARLTHSVGLGLSASITITVLDGNLSGAWVPSSLKFSFGPLAEIEIPDGGLNIKLGDIYTPDPFTIDANAFNTATDTYEVYYASASPAGWDRDAPGAEQELYNFAQAFLANAEALRLRYEETGFNVTTSNGDGARDFSGDSNFATPRMFIWDGTTTNQDVTLNTSNGSIGTIDMSSSGFNGTGLNSQLGVTGFATPNSFSFVNDSTNPFNANLLALNAIAEFESQGDFSFITGSLTGTSGKILNINAPVNIVGGNGQDFLSNIGNAATFFDGGPQDDTFIADFSVHDNDTPISFDLAAMNIGANDRAEIVLSDRSITLESIERIAMRTGDANDVIRTHDDFDRVETGGGNDVVDLFGDFRQDFVDLGAGDDVILANFREISSSQGALQFEDFILGGSGYDAMYLRTGQQGLAIDIFDRSVGSSGSSVFGGLGITADATFAEMDQLQDTYFNLFPSLEARSNTTSNQQSNNFLRLINGESDFGELAVFETIEVINVEDGGFVADDLAMFFGGTRYEGGAGTDTFTANFARFEGLNGLGDRGGVYIDATRDVSLYGATQISGFERFHVTGTTTSDVLRGGALDDFLSGDAGNDVLYGGDDTVADTLLGGAGDDIFRWANDGLDIFDGGDDTDSLLIEADGTETASLRIAYKDANGDFLDPLEWFYADDGLDFALRGLAVATEALETGEVGFNWVDTTDFAFAKNIERIDIIGSEQQNDLLQFFNGTRYEGGESDGDEDLFLADWSAQTVGIQLDLNAEIGAGSAEGVRLTNGVFLSGVERAVLKAGQANDLLIGGALDDHLDGGAGADILMGHGGENSLLGGAGKDLFYHMASGVDDIQGGADDDNLIIGVNGSATDDTVLTVVDGSGDGVGIASQYQRSTSTASMMSLAEDYLADGVTFTYGFGTDQSVSYSGIEVVDFAGSDDFDDVVLFQGGEGYVGGTRAGFELDTFIGDFRGAAENLFFTARDGATANDVGQGTSLSGFERFVLLTGDGDDLIIGGDFDDSVQGGAGDDLMDGGLGDDRFIGGAGDDTYLFTFGQDTVKLGAGEHDTVNIGGITSAKGLNNPVNFLVASITGDINFESPGQGGLGVFSNEFDDLEVSDFDLLLEELELVDFSMAYVWIDAQTGFDGITTSGVEHFEIYGSTQNDVLVAGKRSSILVGDDGDDFLAAHNEESDLLIGGAGDDTYVIMGGKGGRKVIAGEYDSGSRVHFTDFNQNEIFFFQQGTDLAVFASKQDGEVELLIRDYFSNASPSGRDFVFSTADNAGFTTGAIGVGQAPLVAGRTDTGSGDDDVFDDTTNNADTAIGQEGGDQFRSSAGADLYIAGLGSDGIDYSQAGAAIFIDLENFENFGSDAEGDVLVSIEQIHGSDFDDQIGGNHVDNTLIGGAGKDFLFGAEGADTLLGGFDDDEIQGGEGNDLVQGEEGDDILIGEEGQDRLIGGSGDDWLMGEDDADILEGGLGEDIIEGGEGNDFHIYVGGFDLFDGGAGFDTTSFAEFDHAVAVLLFANSATTRFAEDVDETDPLMQQIAEYVDVENVLGSSFNDVLLGDAGANVLDGGRGDDGISGGAGSDFLIGGAGSDTLRYDLDFDATQGAVIDLSGRIFLISTDQAAQDGHGFLDTLTGFENAVGTEFEDDIAGDDFANILQGGGGNDLMGGLAGNDILEGGDGDDQLFGDGATFDDSIEDNDILRGGAGDDFLDGEQGNDILDGGADNDELLGRRGDDVLTGGSGIDTLDGGEGFDIGDYRWTTQGITVTGTGLHSYTATGAEVGTDTGSSIELVLGGLGNDSFIGSSADDRFGHFGGFDSFDGGPDGLDTVTFEYFDAAVDVDMTRASNQAQSNGTEDVTTGGLAAIATFTGIDFIEGSRFGDRLTGAAPAGGLVGLFGGAGNDLITGVLGAFNQLAGGDGDDIFTGLDNFLGLFPGAAEVFDGGEGFDLISFDEAASGVTFSLVIGDGDDVIQNVEGLVGSDFVDFLTGSELADVIDSGLGTDRVEAGGGEDTVIYRGGFDFYDGGAGFDTLDLSAYSTSGLTVAVGKVWTDEQGEAPDVDGGDPATDILTYVDFENFIGTTFGDRLYGDARDNRFASGTGDDRAFGGAGNDLFTYEAGLDIYEGDGGEDTVNYVNFGAAIALDLTVGETETSDSAQVDFAQARTITQVSGIEHVVGTAFDDQITGDGENNILSGLGGNDVLDGGPGNDDLFGGAGIDTVTFLSATSGVTIDLRIETRQDTKGAGLDIIDGFENLTGSVFADTLTGDDEDNIIDGSYGDDIINALDGNDTIILTAGNHLVDGGDGTDTLDMSRNDLGLGVVVHLGIGQADYAPAEGGLLGAGRLTSIENVIGTSLQDFLTGDDGDNMLEGLGGNDVLIGGDGRDAASYARSGAGVRIDLAGETAIGGDAQDDVLIEIENLLGSDHNDSLLGDTGENVLDGGAGNDILNGRAGRDTLSGGEGSDNLNGADGEDGLSGGAGDDTLIGGNDDDLLLGDAGNDILRGDAGEDVLQGGDGEDQLNGGADADALSGGAGDDILSGDDGNDNLVGGLGNDLLQGGDGIDTADYSSAGGRVIANLRRDVTTGAADRDKMSSIENLVGSEVSDVLVGNDFDNVLYGLGGSDVIRGTDGANTMFGGSGNDRIFGGFGVDTIEGGNGDDIIRSGDGDDIIEGGRGNDVIRSGRGEDIARGGDGEDRLFGNRDTDELYGGNDNDRLEGGSGADLLFGGSGDDALRGDSGQDRLEGGEGDDNLFGGENADTFVFLAGDLGVDQIKDWEQGLDQIDLSDWGFESFAEAAGFASNIGTTNMKFDFTSFGVNAILRVENFRVEDLVADDLILS